LLDLPFHEVSAGSDPMLPGACIFLPVVEGMVEVNRRRPSRQRRD
jgi:hypothetical protein